MTCAQLEELINADPSVDDCVVLERLTRGGRTVQVAYVVCSGGLRRDRLVERVRDFFPAAATPELVGIGRVPLTSDGVVDEAMLTSLPVLDDGVLVDWGHRLGGSSSRPERAVAQPSPTSALHLSQLIPGWTRGAFGLKGLQSMPGEPSAATKSRRRRAAAKPGAENAGHRAVSLEGARREKGVRSGQAGETEHERGPSIVHGPPLRRTAHSLRTLGEALERAANESDRGLTYIDADGVTTNETYAELRDRSLKVVSGLRTRGLVVGDRVLVVSADERALLTGVWGCILGGFVPLPIFATNETVAVDAVTIPGTDHVIADRSLAPRIESEGQDVRVALLEELLDNAPATAAHTAQPEHTALLLATSGSTGTKKLVCESHHAICVRAEATAQANGFSKRDASLNWFPLDHVVGLVMFHMRDVYLASEQVHVATPYVLQDPLRWLDLCDQYDISISWAPNFAYALVNEQADRIRGRDWDLSKLGFILNGGEAVVARTARRFMEILAEHGLAESAMRPGWGMSETASGVVFSDSFRLDTTSDDDLFVEVGRPIPGVSLRVVDGEERVVDEGTTGQLQVKGESVTEGYLDAPELTAEAFTDDGWLRTGDLGLIRDGRLVITDRENDEIIVRGINFHAHEIEAAVESVPGVEASYTAAVSIRTEDSETDSLCVVFSPTPDVTDLGATIRSIRGHLTSEIGVRPDLVLPLPAESIPKSTVGKIQRAMLRHDLEEGRLEAALERVDLLTENKHTLPAWFFRKVWQRRDVRPLLSPSPSERLFVILEDDEDFGAAVTMRLEADRHRCIRVQADSGHQESGADGIVEDAARDEQHARLIGLLEREPVQSLTLLDLRTAPPMSGDAAEGREARAGTPGVLALATALAGTASDRAIRVVVVGTRTQRVSPADEVDPTRACTLAVLRTLPTEAPHVRCIHVDLQEESIEDATSVVVDEALSGRESEVAYRAGVRWVPRLAPADFGAEPDPEGLFVQNGFYVVSGGLGGMAEEVAGVLLERFGARLLLLGRTPLPPEASWSDPDTLDSEARVRVDRYQRLRQRGGEVRYAAVDVSDVAAVRAAAAEASTSWSRPPDGVIHLAGLPDRRLLADESWESFRASLSPKIDGAHALRHLLGDREDTIFIASSSVNGFFGGYGVAAYAAGNAFLDAFAEQAAPGRTHVFAWSMWEDVGMSAGYDLRGAVERQGFRMISRRQGIDSLLAGVHLGRHHLFVGLDPRKSLVRRHLASGLLEVERVVLRLGPEEDVPARAGPPILDPFGTPTSCDFERIPEVGETDVRGSSAPAASAPAVELERVIRSLWGEILDTESLDREDNFFDVGGDSLAIAAVSKGLQSLLDRPVPMAMLYEYPTIGLLASYLAQGEAEQSAAIVDSDDKGRERRERMRRRVRSRREA